MDGWMGDGCQSKKKGRENRVGLAGSVPINRLKVWLCKSHDAAKVVLIVVVPIPEPSDVTRPSRRYLNVGRSELTRREQVDIVEHEDVTAIFPSNIKPNVQ